PDPPGGGGDAAVTVELAAEGAGECDGYEADVYNGQRGVGEEKREVGGAGPAGALKMHGAYAEMVDDVGDEEDDGSGGGGEHRDAMGGDVFAADEGVAEEEGYAAGGVEGGVESGLGEHGGEDRDEEDRQECLSYV